MKILVKQTDELRGSTQPLANAKIVEEYLVYLMDDTGRPLSADIVYGTAAKNDVVTELLTQHFLPLDWENNKATFDVSSIVEEVSYAEYLNKNTLV